MDETPVPTIIPPWVPEKTFEIPQTKGEAKRGPFENKTEGSKEARPVRDASEVIKN